jgi:hypothetical protein
MGTGPTLPTVSGAAAGRPEVFAAAPAAPAPSPRSPPAPARRPRGSAAHRQTAPATSQRQAPTPPRRPPAVGRSATWPGGRRGGQIAMAWSPAHHAPPAPRRARALLATTTLAASGRSPATVARVGIGGRACGAGSRGPRRPATCPPIRAGRPGAAQRQRQPRVGLGPSGNARPPRPPATDGGGWGRAFGACCSASKLRSPAPPPGDGLTRPISRAVTLRHSLRGGGAYSWLRWLRVSCSSVLLRGWSGRAERCAPRD